MQNFNKQQPKPKINIPKTPQQIFLKKADDVKQQQIHLEPLKHVKTVKYIDELYLTTFFDNYFDL